MFLPYGKGHIEFDAGKNHTVLSPDYAGIRADRAGIDIVRSAMENQQAAGGFLSYQREKGHARS